MSQSQCFAPDFGSSSLKTRGCLRVLVQMRQVAHPARKGEQRGWRPMQKPILWLKHVLLSGHVGQEESSSQVLRCSLGPWHCQRGLAPPCPAHCNACLVRRASAPRSGQHLGLEAQAVPGFVNFLCACCFRGKGRVQCTRIHLIFKDFFDRFKSSQALRQMLLHQQLWGTALSVLASQPCPGR